MPAPSEDERLSTAKACAWQIGEKGEAPEIDARYPNRLSPERCDVCGDPVTVGELARVRSDVDFVEHGERGHLVRLT